MSRGTREVCPALISPPLASLPGEAALEEVLRRPPREAWPLERVLNFLLMKMARTNLPAQPCRGPHAGKSRDPRAQGALGLGFEAKPEDQTQSVAGPNILRPWSTRGG